MKQSGSIHAGSTARDDHLESQSVVIEKSVQIPMKSEIPFKVDMAMTDSFSFDKSLSDPLYMTGRSGKSGVNSQSPTMRATLEAAGVQSSITDSLQNSQLSATSPANMSPRSKVKVVSHQRISQLNQLIEAKRRQRIKVATLALQKAEDERIKNEVINNLNKPDTMKSSLDEFKRELIEYSNR